MPGELRNTRHRRASVHCGAVYGSSPTATLAHVAHVPTKPHRPGKWPRPSSWFRWSRTGCCVCGSSSRMTVSRARRGHRSANVGADGAATPQRLPDDACPSSLLHDRDAAFAGVAGTITAMPIQQVVTAPRSRWRNAYVECVRAYQHSLPAPPPPVGSFDGSLAEHGRVPFSPDVRQLPRRRIRHREQQREAARGC